MNAQTTFHAWLKTALQAPGRSQSALARALGLDSSAINRLVNGKRDLRVREIDAVADYLRSTGGSPEEISYLASVLGDRQVTRQEETRNLVTALIDGSHERNAVLRRAIVSAGKGLRDAISAAATKANWVVGEERFGRVTTQIVLKGAFNDSGGVLVEALYRLGFLAEEGRDDLILIMQLWHRVISQPREQDQVDSESLQLLYGFMAKFITSEALSPLNEETIKARFVSICLVYELLLTAGDLSTSAQLLHRVGDRLDLTTKPRASTPPAEDA